MFANIFCEIVKNKYHSQKILHLFSNKYAEMLKRKTSKVDDKNSAM